MTIRMQVAAAIVAIITATSSGAVPINLDFSFEGRSGTISGTVFGLDNEVVGPQSASSVEISGLFGVYTLPPGAFILLPAYPSFGNEVTFVSQELSSIEISYNQGGIFPCLCPTDGSLIEFDLRLTSGRLNEDTFIPVFTNTISEGSISYTQRPVPLPAGGLLLLSGLVGVFARKNRKKFKV